MPRITSSRCTGIARSATRSAARWKYLRRGALDRSAVIERLDTTEELFRGREYLVEGPRVMDLVVHSSCAAYDCEYVALAETLDVPLVTNDGPAWPHSPSGRRRRQRSSKPGANERSCVFAFAAHALALGEKLNERAPSDYVVASELRRLVEAHDAAFRWNRIQLPDSKQYPGEVYLGAFERAAHQLEGWMVEHYFDFLPFRTATVGPALEALRARYSDG